ncbi:hypothetical protein [Niveispirillum sp. BGYR6]|nr:hypothetical protein [Niveispirillum sp. BGYR6]MDG5494190.1 hypothetical protein [Niveispirillum sp. BGYR6]
MPRIVYVNGRYLLHDQVHVQGEDRSVHFDQVGTADPLLKGQ